jgi:hypothetical protein
MSKSNYPLIESMGLKPLPGRIYHNRGSQYAAGSETEVICAFDLERALAQAPVAASCGEYVWHARGPLDNDTHTARLICVKPIVRDSAESLLREIVDAYKSPVTLTPFIDRARRLLESK